MIKKPTILIIAGPNGAGKTTLSSGIKAGKYFHGPYMYINPDEIAKKDFGSWSFPPEDWLKAAVRASELREACLKAKSNMLIETVMSTQDKIDFMSRCQTAGYFIHLFFVGTNDPEINAARIAQRYKLGGHVVPIDKIVDRFYKSISNCVRAAGIADRSYIYDNSVANRAPELSFKTKNGIITDMLPKTELNLWARELAAKIDALAVNRQTLLPPLRQWR